MTKVVCALLFILGGVLHTAATSTFVDENCVSANALGIDFTSTDWCRATFFGPDLMAQWLSFWVGVDVGSFVFDVRARRLIALSCVVAGCAIISEAY